jgi:hypothetical protein
MAKRRNADVDADLEARVRELLDEDLDEGFERTQRILAERIAYYDRKLEEKRRLQAGKGGT